MSKFIDLRHQHIKQITRKKKIKIEHLPPKNCLADMFTKPLDRTRFEELQDMVEVREIPGLEQEHCQMPRGRQTAALARLNG